VSVTIRRTAAVAAVAAAATLAALPAQADQQNPYLPSTGHPYRHGAVNTREMNTKANKWTAQQKGNASTSSRTLAYGGGVDGIGVTHGAPKVYLVVYGSQWGTQGTDASGNLTFSGDKNSTVPLLQNMFKGLGTGGEQWSGVMTQYCDGTGMVKGATKCSTGATHVGYPSGGAFAGIWYDNSVASPSQATGNQLAAEAVKAAGHFGNTAPGSNRLNQYVILSPTGTHPDGFNTSTGQFCAWHDWNGDTTLSGGAAASSYGDIAFTNMPYVVDMGSSCGQNFVNSGTTGVTDGVTMVEGHEYAETITDQNPAGGWTNQTTSRTYRGQENADECAWISPGTAGGAANVAMGNGSYTEQATWSNDTNSCAISHPTVG
jgi:hypothetical protein